METAACLTAILFGVTALVGLYHPRIGHKVYQDEWPGYQTDATRRRTAYVMCGAFAITVTCLGLARLLQRTRQDPLIITSLIVLALAFVLGFVGLAAAIWLRRSRL